MRGCETTGRFAGVSGRAGCVGLPGSSMRNRIVGGTTRGGACGSGEAASTGTSSTGGGAAATGGAGSTTGGGGSTRGGSGAGGASGTGAGATTTCGGGGGATGGASSTTAAGAAGGCGGLTVLTRRGGPRTGAAGLGGSAFFGAEVFFAPPFTGAGVSANMSPLGSEMPRCRAIRSTKDRATTSSIVLDALFNSMP
jgi:hypothetical protein